MQQNEKYQEIHKLCQILTEKGIPYVLVPICDGWQVCYPCEGPNRVCSAVQHYYSYGSGVDRIEIMGLLSKSEIRSGGGVAGYLTANNVAKRIIAHYKKQKRRGNYEIH